MTPTLAPRCWTADAVIDRLLEVAGLTEADLRRSLAVTREALEATTRRGRPDHGVRLQAADRIFGMVGLRGGRHRGDGDGPAPVTAVAITLHVPAAPTEPAAVSAPPPYRHLKIAARNGTNGNGHGHGA